MSQFSDEQIQQLLDAGQSIPDTGSAVEMNEAKLYRHLFDELKQDLPIRPTPDFSIRVMSQIEELQLKLTDTFPYGWFALGLVICLSVGIQLIAPFDGEGSDLLSVFTSLKPFKWGLIFGVSSLLVFQFLDLKLIREPSLTNITDQ